LNEAIRSFVEVSNAMALLDITVAEIIVLQSTNVHTDVENFRNSFIILIHSLLK